jgi:hypothetical protein
VANDRKMLWGEFIVGGVEAGAHDKQVAGSESDRERNGSESKSEREVESARGSKAYLLSPFCVTHAAGCDEL